MPVTVARAFAESVAMKDSIRLRALMSHRIDFAALFPDKAVEASDREDVVDILINRWLPPGLSLTLDRVDVDVVADRQRVGYRMSVEGADGVGMVEHQAFLGVVRGKVTWLRLLSSGIRWNGSADPDAELP